MNEEFLYYIWTHRLINKDLQTATGEEVVILSPGVRNYDSGPDFFNALIEIDGTKWAGNVEMHVNASDWKKHNHHQDSSYSSIILHVVYNNDSQILRKNGEPVPALELKNTFNDELLQKYHRFLNSKNSIPCGNQLCNINKLDKLQWFDRLLVERLEKKANDINSTLLNTRNDFLQVFYQQITRSLGYTANAESMEMLASITPLKLLLKHIKNKNQIEALLFGQAGLLKNPDIDLYIDELRTEYRFLKTKYRLTGMEPGQWKFMRMRPASFPTIRISQLANIIYNSSGLLYKVLETDRLDNVVSLLSASASEYWNDHYQFGKPVPGKTKKLGKTTIDVILINAIIPFLFVYGKIKDDFNLNEKAINWISQIKSESNKITQEFSSVGIIPENAMQSQALLQLKSNYCNRKHCLRCRFGHTILNGGIN